MAQEWWASDPVVKPAQGPLPSPPKQVTPPTPFQVEDQAIAREKADRDKRAWNADRNPDGTKKGEDEKAYSQSALDAFDRAISTAGRLKKHPGFYAAVGMPSINPLDGNLAGFVVPGSRAADFRAELDALKAQVFLPMVQSMKGMGALSNAEGQKLTDAIGALDPRMSEGGFSASLDRVVKDLQSYRDRGAGKAPARPVLRPKAATGWGKATVVE